MTTTTTTTTAAATAATARAASLVAAPKKALRAALWIVQGLLAVAFVIAGFMKMTTPLDVLAQQMAWAGNVPGGLVRFIGVAELLGGLGLVLPAATRIKPVLTPLAAAGLLTVMLLAAGYHLTHGEGAFILPNVILGALAAFVAWGRFKAAPIVGRV